MRHPRDQLSTSSSLLPLLQYKSAPTTGTQRTAVHLHNTTRRIRSSGGLFELASLFRWRSLRHTKVGTHHTAAIATTSKESFKTDDYAGAVPGEAAGASAAGTLSRPGVGRLNALITNENIKKYTTPNTRPTGIASSAFVAR